MAGSAEELVALLDLEQLEVDLFRGTQARTERQRVFGGQVAAQAVVAATRSVEGEFVLHSLHSYFLRPGDTDRADRLRRRADPRRALVRHPPGLRAPARAADLLHDGQLPDPRAGPRAPGPDARRRAARAGHAAGRARPRARSRGGRALGARVGGARHPPRRRDRSRHPRRPRRTPARARLWIKVDGADLRRPDAPDRGVHLRQRPDAARRGARAARHPHRLTAAAAGLARPHDLVPPAVPRRRLVALRPVLAVRRRRARPRARAGVLAVGRAGGDGGPGGADPGARARPCAFTMGCRTAFPVN